MAGVGDKLMTASEIKAVTDTKLPMDLRSLEIYSGILQGDHLFVVQQPNSGHANRLTLVGLSNKILGDISIVNGNDRIVPLSHGGTGAATATDARTVLSVYSKAETNNAISDSIAITYPAMSLFTNIDSHIDQEVFIRRRSGNTIYISFRMSGGITPGSSGLKMFDIDASIAPVSINMPVPIVNGQTAALVTNASVWLETSHPGQVTLYGENIPTLSTGHYYVTFSYLCA